MRQSFVRVQDAEGRAVFRAPLLRSVPRHTLPRGLALPRADLVAFLQEQLAAHRPDLPDHRSTRQTHQSSSSEETP